MVTVSWKRTEYPPGNAQCGKFKGTATTESNEWTRCMVRCHLTSLSLLFSFISLSRADTSPSDCQPDIVRGGEKSNRLVVTDTAAMFAGWCRQIFFRGYQ